MQSRGPFLRLPVEAKRPSELPMIAVGVDLQTHRRSPRMERNIPYVLIIIIAGAAFGIVLMIWALEGTSGGRQAAQTAPPHTTTTAPKNRKPDVTPVPSN